MGNYDGAEIYELVGFYMLSVLGKVNGVENVGLYMDDRLACLHKINGPGSDKIRKDIVRTFRENFGLNIIITTNLKVINFLDVIFDLCTRNANLIRDRTTHLPISMSSQTIHLISSRNRQRAFQKE